MHEPRVYEFGERLRMSQGKSESASVQSIVLENVPGAVAVHSAHSSNDRMGTDWWAETRGGSFLSIDAKVRSQDWAAKGQDDLALETWSVVEANKVGWTRDPAKRTDYVLWLWTDTGRWCLVPFQMLCAVFDANWQDWTRAHKTRRQHTPNARGGYHSECVFVPRRDVWAAIYNRFGGAA